MYKLTADSYLEEDYYEEDYYGIGLDIEAMRECISQLEPKRRLIIEKRLEGKTYNYIARGLGIGRERVFQLNKDAISVLKKMLYTTDTVTKIGMLNRRGDNYSFWKSEFDKLEWRNKNAH